VESGVKKERIRMMSLPENLKRHLARGGAIIIFPRLLLVEIQPTVD